MSLKSNEVIVRIKLYWVHLRCTHLVCSSQQATNFREHWSPVVLVSHLAMQNSPQAHWPDVSGGQLQTNVATLGWKEIGRKDIQGVPTIPGDNKHLGQGLWGSTFDKHPCWLETLIYLVASESGWASELPRKIQNNSDSQVHSRPTELNSRNEAHKCVF